MAELKVQITSFIDDWFPGWVSCSFIDIYGTVHLFEEKGPVVSADYLDAKSEYPQNGVIGCSILNKKDNILTIDIGVPLGIETKSGKTVFEVYEQQIIFK